MVIKCLLMLIKWLDQHHSSCLSLKTLISPVLLRRLQRVNALNADGSPRWPQWSSGHLRSARRSSRDTPSAAATNETLCLYDYVYLLHMVACYIISFYVISYYITLYDM